MPKIRIHIKTIVEMIGSIQPPPVIILPIFCCLPRFVVGMPVALASSTKTEKVIRELIKTDLFGYFTRISGGDSVKNSKPAPDIFLRTAELLGKEPQKCLVIEDSFNGVRAAKAAGMKCIMVPDLLQPDDEIKALADMFVPSLTELKELFAEGNI